MQTSVWSKEYKANVLGERLFERVMRPLAAEGFPSITKRTLYLRGDWVMSMARYGQMDVRRDPCMKKSLPWIWKCVFATL